MAESLPIISAHSLHKVYLERVILDDVSFTVHAGQRVALLGANGAGKSTLLGILAGQTPVESGEVRRRRGLSVTYLSQEGSLDDAKTVGETIDSAFAHVRELEAELEQVHHRLEEQGHGPEAESLIARQGELMEYLEHHDIHTIESRQAEAMRELGVPEAHRLVGQLSGGERRRVALCRTLLEDPDLLLLDEPTNHLDAETLEWLEQFLAAFAGTVIFVTHDRYFLDNVATTMIELRRGRAVVYAGNYSDYLQARQEEEERAARAESTRQNLLRRELEWLRRQPKARTTKSQARIDRAHDLIESKPLAPDGRVQMLIPTGPRLGKTLIETEHLRVDLGGVTLVEDFTFHLGPGDRVGIVGRNGLGKTTLLRTLMKELEPTAGEVRHGSSIKFVYADQARRSLDPEKTVLQEVAGELEWVEIGGQRIGFRSWLGRFLFDDNTAAMPIRLLSGGERNRVQLAKMLREGGNVVVLDEPTNDLDLPTLRILEEALANYEGCAFIVSHDRYFLNRVANRIIAFRGDGRIAVVEGNYDHYRAYLQKEKEKEKAAPAPAAKPREEPRRREEPARDKKKLTFNEQREFDTLEQRIMEAENRVEELEARAADPTTFAGANRDEAVALMESLEQAKAEVERLYNRWEELGERA